ncbi:9326_t:CDS:2, partial [Gigaspora margarita]
SFLSEVSEASEDYEAADVNEVDETTDFNIANDIGEATDFTFADEIDEITELNEVTIATAPIIAAEDIDNPKHWSSRKKCLILFVLTITGTIIITTSSILFPALITLRKEFDTSEVAVNSLCNISRYLSIVCAAYSDRFATRRKVLLISMIVYIIPSILCSLTNKIWQLLILSAIQACGSSSTVSISAGIISDIYFPNDRGFAFGIFTLAPSTLLGTASGVLQNISVARNFSARSYNLAPSSIGLLFLAPTLGNSIGSAVGGKYSDFILQKAKKNGAENIRPEMRIKSAFVGALIVPCFYLVYGWLLTIDFNIYVLMILWFFTVFATYIVYNSLSPYLIDVCPGLGASAIALSYCMRLIATGIAAFFGTVMEDALGTGWYYTLISSLCFLPASFLVLVYFNGKRWQAKFFREN